MAALQVVKTNPGSNSTNASCTGHVSIEFSNDLDRSCIPNVQIYLTRIDSQIVLSVDTGTISIVGRTLIFDVPTDSGLTSGNGLIPGAQYQVTAAAGIVDIHKYKLLSPYAWLFTTSQSSVELVEAPVLISPTNGQYVEVNELRCSWTPNVTATHYELQISAETTFNPLALPLITVYGTSMTGNVASTLQQGSYRARVRTVTPIGTSRWSNVADFVYAKHIPVKGEPPAFGSLWEKEARRPQLRLLRTTPRDNTANSTPESIVLTFSSVLDPDTLTIGSPKYAPPTIEGIPLYGGQTHTLPVSGWTVSGTTLTYTPTNPRECFRYNTTYQVFLNPALRASTS